MKKTICRCVLGLLAFGFVASTGAQEKGPDDWKYTFAIYLWGTGLEGTSQIGPVAAPVSLSFGDALDNLDGALTLHFEAQKRNWGFLADVHHISVAPKVSLPNGAPLNLDVTNTIFELGGTYKPSASEVFELVYGLRFSNFKLEGSVPGIASATVADESWTDGFIGGRLVAPFTDNWRFRARADIGGGDSDFVWQAILAADYQFNDRVSAFLGYRWLDYDYDNGEAGPNRFTYDITYEGPLAAVMFKW